MYTEQTIETLSERLGFGSPLEEGFTIELSEANLVGASGRFVKSFHSLANVENIYAALPTFVAEEAEDKFNEYLESLRYQAAKAVLTAVIDKNTASDNSVSYDTAITDNIALFDEAIGFKIAMMALELFMTTKESNLAERNAKLAIGNLKLELEGFRNDAGNLVAKGLVQKYDNAVKSATRKIFPIVPTVKNGEYW